MKSPCIKVCEFEGDVCRGCGRTKREIRTWKKLDPLDQRLVAAEAQMRLLSLEARGRRKRR